jgi:hypothetical protein
MAPEDLGMNYLADAIKTGLKSGDLKEKNLNRLSMEDAVKLANDQRLVNESKVSELPIVRDYPDTGFQWKELTNEDPEVLDKILKREGEIMQNCVGDGGYCDDILESGTKLFSLRDKANNPHVTIEVKPKPVVFSDVQKLLGDEEADRLLESNTIKEIIEMHPELRQFNIKQVKGKQNEAPISDYIPYVQDFVMNPVTGSPFNKVGDLANTNLVDLERLRKHGLFDLYVPGSGREIDKELRRIYPPMTGQLGGEVLSGEFGVRTPSYELLRNVVQDLPGNYATPTNLVDYLKAIEPKPIEQGFSNFTQGFAAGGLVGSDDIDYDEAYEFRDYGTRETGEDKEAGALGEIRMPDGRDVMTEYSINVDGKEMPSIIEGMHPADINYIRETGEVPEDAVRTAVRNASKREAEGKSAFYNRKEDKGFAEGGQYNDPFADMSMADKIALLARGAKKRYIDNFTASNQHGQYPEQLAAGLKDKYFVELGNLRKNRGPLDVAINYGGGYDFAANKNVPPQDVRDMAKAYQLFDYMTSMKDTSKADAIGDYYENMAGVEAGLAGRGRGRMPEEDLQRMAAKYGMSKATKAPAFVEQKYAEGGIVYNDYDEMYEFR